MIVACDATDERDGSAGRPTATPTSTATPESTATPSETPSPDLGEQLVRCENPEGFTIAHPESWQTNRGDVVPPCSQFHPTAFGVPEASDERVAAITAFIDPVPFDRVSAPRDRRDADRTELTIDDLDAVRLEYEIQTDALWPEGTPITMYMIDIPPASDGDERTLFVDTVGLDDFDYEENQDVLDVMARSVEWTDA